LKKTYDYVEWSYLYSVMLKMYFPAKWRKWMLERMSATTTSCRFRYGDLVFSFLLVINILLNSFVNVGLFTWFSLDDDSTFRVYHLQLSNDTLFIGKDSWGNNRAIKANPLLFEMISSLKVNFHKSLLMRVIFAALSVSRTPYFYSSAT
jgi:hypothetical protein